MTTRRALAFDADALIYAAAADIPSGHLVRRAILEAPAGARRAGSVVLLPEVLSKPLRLGRSDQLAALYDLLSRLELHPADRTVAAFATDLGAEYHLRAADAVHLATAIASGADAFVTNNTKDFDERIEEIAIVRPEQLPG